MSNRSKIVKLHHYRKIKKLKRFISFIHPFYSVKNNHPINCIFYATLSITEESIIHFAKYNIFDMY